MRIAGAIYRYKTHCIICVFIHFAVIPSRGGDDADADNLRVLTPNDISKSILLYMIRVVHVQ